MRVMELLKPVKLNVAGSIILFSLLPVIPVYCSIFDASGRVLYFSLVSIIRFNIQNNRIELLPNVVSALPVIAMIAVYLFFSLIGLAWSRSKISFFRIKGRDGKDWAR